MTITKLKKLLEEVEKDALKAHGFTSDKVRIKSIAISWRFNSPGWEFESPSHDGPEAILCTHLFLTPG